MHAATTYLFNLFVIAKRMQMRVIEKAATDHKKRCSKLRRHVWEKRGTSGSDRRRIRGGWRARKRLGQCIVAARIGASWRRASTHAGRLAGCMHNKLLSWWCAQAFYARDGPTKPWPNGRTATPTNTAPLVRVNDQSTDPTATSVVTCSEGFGQGSGEK